MRDRVEGLVRARAGDLRPAARNWRTHPPGQREALRRLLEAVGWVQALVARRAADGGLEIVDGHLRADLDPDEFVPVVVVDLDEEEAALALATMDPVGAMAERDDAALRALLERLELGDLEVAVAAGLVRPPDVPPADFRDAEVLAGHVDYRCPGCAYEWAGSPVPGAP